MIQGVEPPMHPAQQISNAFSQLSAIENSVCFEVRQASPRQGNTFGLGQS
jgi:hypothetical protein